MNIKQIFVEKRIYGLGEDNKLYTWNHGTISWDPYWNQMTAEEKEKVSAQLSNPGDQSSDGQIL